MTVISSIHLALNHKKWLANVDANVAVPAAVNLVPAAAVVSRVGRSILQFIDFRQAVLIFSIIGGLI